MTLEAGCVTPVGKANALSPACEEGSWITLGDYCTPRCRDGFAPTRPKVLCDINIGDSSGMLLETLFECKSEKNSTEVVKELVCAKESKEVSCENALTEPLLCMVDEERVGAQEANGRRRGLHNTNSDLQGSVIAAGVCGDECQGVRSDNV